MAPPPRAIAQPVRMPLSQLEPMAISVPVRVGFRTPPPSPSRAATPLPSCTSSAPLTSGGGLLEYSQKLGRQVENLKVEVAKLQAERDELRTENQVIGEHVFGLQKENGMLQDIGRTSFIEKADLAKRAQGVGAEASQMRRTLQQHAERIEALVRENGQLRAAVEALQAERAQSSHIARSLEATIESLQADVGKHVSHEAALERRSTLLERQAEDLKAEKERLDSTVSGLHLELGKMQQVSSELQAERAQSHALAQKLEIADMEISRCYHEKAELDQMVSALHVEAAQAKTRRDSALSEIPVLQSSLHQQGTMVTDLQGQVAQLQRSIRDVQHQNLALDRQVKLQLVELEKANKDRTQREQAIAALHAERGRLREALDGLSAGKAEADRRLTSTAGEKYMIQGHFDQMNAEKEQLHIRLQQALAENTSIRSRMIGLEKMVQGFQDETSHLQERSRLLRHEKEQLEERLAQIQQTPPGQRYPPAPLQPSQGGTQSGSNLAL